MFQATQLFQRRQRQKWEICKHGGTIKEDKGSQWSCPRWQGGQGIWKSKTWWGATNLLEIFQSCVALTWAMDALRGSCPIWCVQIPDTRTVLISVHHRGSRQSQHISFWENNTSLTALHCSIYKNTLYILCIKTNKFTTQYFRIMMNFTTTTWWPFSSKIPMQHQVRHDHPCRHAPCSHHATWFSQIHVIYAKSHHF